LNPDRAIKGFPLPSGLKRRELFVFGINNLLKYSGAFVGFNFSKKAI